MDIMKENRNMTYFHEDKSLKYLKELAYKYFSKALGLENYDEIRDESQILDPRTLRVDMAFKGKDKINIYEFLFTKNSLMDVIRRIFLYLANAVVKYEMKVDVNLLTTPSVNKDSGILEHSTNQFFKPKILSFKDCDGDKFLSNINMKLKITKN